MPYVKNAFNFMLLEFLTRQLTQQGAVVLHSAVTTIAPLFFVLLALTLQKLCKRELLW